MLLQSALQMIYPAQCLLCDALVEETNGLCATCWRDTPFVTGLACDTCGASLPGHSDGVVQCDDCMRLARPWQRGRAAVSYRDKGRHLVLALKHGDRQDLARPAAEWMEQAGKDLLQDDPLLVPIPLHWTRLVKRRFNQAGVLAQLVAKRAGVQVATQALVRKRRTSVQDGKGVPQRFSNLENALCAHPSHARALVGRRVVLVDDVMTSGATLAAGTEVCLSAGATSVSVLVLARVGKDD